ncbi:hypothetical protein FG93_01926 [Bosea sp. LC85]|uniref:hypothetical protein n=1 Tax=Bosea sp. LC85 TaxID=1502851 RepID=UPI0004E4170C|nr:hypothetical protein [Bosea sp. LC85]KFC73182.1 hypothetical protein FG93_01926 [Bosea sp. LC85]
MADLPPSDGLQHLMGWLQQSTGLKWIHVFAGIAGGVTRGLVTKNVSWAQRISSAIVGGLTAGYCTPAVTPMVRKWLDTFDLWSQPGGDIEGSLGFCLGLVGMTVCDAAIRWAQRLRDGPPPFPLPPKSSG